MSTYKELKGLRVKYVPTDTTSPSTAAEGDVWYNSATFQLKAYVGVAAWSASSGLGTARYGMGSFGIQTAAVGAGGYTGPPNGKSNKTEEYNGSGWAAGGDTNQTIHNRGGAGTLTAGLVFGASSPYPGATEEYNGSAWTESGDLNDGRAVYEGQAGTQTAALAFGGFSPGNVAVSESYDGSSWTEGPDLNTGRRAHCGAGTQTAALCYTGYTTTVIASTEEYNGSSWTSGNNNNTARANATGSGIQTAAIAASGNTGGSPQSTATETYDGTTWTNSPASIGTGRSQAGSGGTTSAKVAFGGYPGPAGMANTEEFNHSFQVVTAGAWASGGALNTNRRAVGINGIGPSQNAALCVSGYPPSSSSDIKNVESYDGSSWTEVGDVNLSRYRGSCAGTTTAGLFFGGNSDVTPGGVQDLCEEYDGSSWTESGDLPTAIEAGASFGTQTAAVRAGGSAPPFPNYQTNTDEYNGSSWTAVPATISQAVSVINGVGTETAGLIWGGSQSPNPPSTAHPSIATTQTYNGSAFTTVNACIEQVNGQGCGGTQTAAFGVGGGPGTKTRMQTWDGTNWSTGPALGTGRNALSGGGTATAGLAFAGNPGGGVEEFTAASTADTASTIDFD